MITWIYRTQMTRDITSWSALIKYRFLLPNPSTCPSYYYKGTFGQLDNKQPFCYAPRMLSLSPILLGLYCNAQWTILAIFQFLVCIPVRIASALNAVPTIPIRLAHKDIPHITCNLFDKDFLFANKRYHVFLSWSVYSNKPTPCLKISAVRSRVATVKCLNIREWVNCLPSMNTRGSVSLMFNEKIVWVVAISLKNSVPLLQCMDQTDLRYISTLFMLLRNCPRWGFCFLVINTSVLMPNEWWYRSRHS